MGQSAGFRLRIEPLKAGHVTSYPQGGEHQAALPPSTLQTLLVQNWVSGLGGLIRSPLTTRTLRVLTLLETASSQQDQLLALALLRPGNRRSTCWQLDLLQVRTPERFSRSQALQLLIQGAMKDPVAQSPSWLVRCDPLDRITLDVLRESGFQPLLQRRIWRAPETSSAPSEQPSLACPEGIQWMPVSRSNVKPLLSLEQSSISPQHRQIIDRQWIDLLDRRQGSLVLMAGVDREPVAIAGLLNRPWGLDASRYEFVRGPAWDARISAAFSSILQRWGMRGRPLELLVNEDDHSMQGELERLGWTSGGSELLLGRSLWRRVSQREPAGLRSLETMLGHLQPQHPPLPTPTLAPRR